MVTHYIGTHFDISQRKKDEERITQLAFYDQLTGLANRTLLLERLVADGKVIYAGSSNFAGWHIAKANDVAHYRNYLGLVSEQSPYNLLERTIELEVIPACQDYGLAVLPWSPLAGGLLAGALQGIAYLFIYLNLVAQASLTRNVSCSATS